MTKYLFLIISLNLTLFSQSELFLPSESREVKPISYNTWFAENDKEFEGVYQMLTPSDGESDGQAEKITLRSIYWSNELDTYTGTGTSELEVADWSQYDTLRNIRISCEGESLTGSTCSFKAEGYTGDFIILQYKTKTGKYRETKGILTSRFSKPEIKYFYEKIMQGSGGYNERNSILLSGKELKFGMSLSEFINIYPDFTSKEPADGFIIYGYSTNYDNSFNNYWYTAKFNNDKLICFEINGWQTSEYQQILKNIIDQFEFVKTVKEQNEDIGETRTDYYKKDDLQAEYYAFETSVLNICLNR